MTIRKVVLDKSLKNDLFADITEQGNLVVLPAKRDLEKLKIGKFGRIYFTFKDGVLYKLHSDISKYRVSAGGATYKFRWISMYNSVGWTGVGGEKTWDNIEDALKAVLDYKCQVIQADGNSFKNILSFFETEI
jgi:hypothetical protein